MRNEVWIVQYAASESLYGLWDKKETVEKWMKAHGMRKGKECGSNGFDILARDEDEVIYHVHSRPVSTEHKMFGFTRNCKRKQGAG